MHMSIMSDPGSLLFHKECQNHFDEKVDLLPFLQFFFSSISSFMVKHSKKVLTTSSSPSDEDHVFTKTHVHFVITQF